jgi:ketopantoate hydroxymethyltransferase
MSKTKITIPQVQQFKEQDKKIKMIVAYDYPMASLIDRSDAEMILVGRGSRLCETGRWANGNGSGTCDC